MKKMKIFYCSIGLFFPRITVYFILSIFGFSLFAQSDKNYPQVEIPGTSLIKINSSIIGEEYIINVLLPRDYNDTTKTFPIVYLLDAQWDFPLLNSIYGCQFYDGYIPNLIIAGITWGGQNPDVDYKRARDFTPTNIKQMKHSGGADKFIQFIKKELIPFMESNFRVKKDDRTIMGSSFGGLFTLYALFSESDTFNKFILTSPSLQWDNGILYDFEKKFYEKKPANPIRVAMSIGDKENVPQYEKFMDHLKKRKYKNVEFYSRVLENTGHAGTKAEGYSRGLQFVFKRSDIKVDPEILMKYTGTYKGDNGIIVKLVMEKNELHAITPEGYNLKPKAETESDFYQDGQFLNIRFKKDSNKETDGFLLEQYSSKTYFKKLKK